MHPKSKQAALVAAFSALAALAIPVHAQSPEGPTGLYAVEDIKAGPCSEATRELLREMTRTDGDVAPPLQSEEECRRQYFVDETQR